jgi:formate dehydrogenase maturation protein FdhE
MDGYIEEKIIHSQKQKKNGLNNLKRSNMPQQTAVEWLMDRLPHSIETQFSKQIEQAKEMEKQQIMEAVYDSMGTNFDPNMGRAEDYYNETFNK